VTKAAQTETVHPLAAPGMTPPYGGVVQGRPAPERGQEARFFGPERGDGSRRHRRRVNLSPDSPGVLYCPVGDASRGSEVLFGISSSAVPAWDQGNGADQSDSRPDRMECDRRKAPSELVPSIVPRGIDPPAGELEVLLSFDGRTSAFGQMLAGVISLLQRNSVPSIHMRWVTTLAT